MIVEVLSRELHYCCVLKQVLSIFHAIPGLLEQGEREGREGEREGREKERGRGESLGTRPYKTIKLFKQNLTTILVL
jgi:hypothetical protein